MFLTPHTIASKSRYVVSQFYYNTSDYLCTYNIVNETENDCDGGTARTKNEFSSGEKGVAFQKNLIVPEGARNSPGLPLGGAGGPCPGGPVRNSGGPPPAPGGGYSPVTATAAAIPAKLAGSKPVRNRLRVLFREDRIRPAISEPGCHNYRDLPTRYDVYYSRDRTRDKVLLSIP